MKLETAEAIASNNVTKEELINAFKDDANRGEFVILTKGEHFFIQASGEYDGPYIMEYREGDANHHFKCIQDLSKENVQLAFIKYLEGDDSWKTDFEWKLLEIKDKPWWKFWQ